MELHPNRWYEFGEAFGEELLDLIRFRRGPDGILLATHCKAEFRGGHIILDLDPRTNYDQRNYYPLNDQKGRKNHKKPAFGEVVLFVHPVNSEDFVGEPRFSSAIAELEQDYRFRIFVRSPQGIFVSYANATYPNFIKGGEAMAFFEDWRPLEGTGRRKLLTSYGIRSLSNLEIMLAEKPQ